MQKVRAFLIDLDGTLIDSISLHTYSSILATKEVLNERFDPIEFVGLVGESFEDIIRYFDEKYWDRIYIDDETMKKLKEVKNKYFLEKAGKDLLFSYAKELLSYLKSRGYKLALVSASFRSFIEEITKKLEIRDYFDAIVSSEDVLNSKPDPEPYLKAMEILNVEPEECIVLEDSYYGIVSGKRAGAKVFAIINGEWDLEDIKRANPDKIFKNIKELLEYLRANGY